MIEVKGKYNVAKVFTDTAEVSTIDQIRTFCDMEAFKDSKIRIMPDCHAGKGCTIGTTMTIDDKVIPSAVGVDIGCGMLAVKLKEKRIDLPKFDSIVHQYIPAGFDRHAQVITEFDLADIIADFDYDIAARSVGTLGGGNHFIELDRDSEDNIWLVIHTGSRHLGVDICEYYQKIGYKKLNDADPMSMSNYKQLSSTLVEKFKAEGRQEEIESALADLKKRMHVDGCNVPYVLAYVEGEDLDNYLNDMRIAQHYAAVNRETIAKRILKYAKLHDEDMFDTIHNYIDIDNMILRKGSISAQKGERSIIPMNMRDGSLICAGKGNPDWNFSAPHGAGRLMSRTEAKNSLSMREFKDTMKGIYSSSIGRDTIDEAPMAYKPMEEILSYISDTVDVVDVIKPIYNFKAGDAK